MSLIKTFDIQSDFYADPELSTIFKEEKLTVPSKVMWALILYTHPESSYYQLDDVSKRDLIASDYLEDKTFNFDDYAPTLNKIRKFLLSKTERLLNLWENKLEERYALMEATPYSSTSYEMLDKMMKETHNMWKNYHLIRDSFLKEKEIKTQGNIMESLSERLAI